MRRGEGERRGGRGERGKGRGEENMIRYSCEELMAVIVFVCST